MYRFVLVDRSAALINAISGSAPAIVSRVEMTVPTSLDCRTSLIASTLL
jgi:hypothetical protein